MEAIFNNRRDSVLKSLQENQSEIAILNADIETQEIKSVIYVRNSSFLFG